MLTLIYRALLCNELFPSSTIVWKYRLWLSFKRVDEEAVGYCLVLTPKNVLRWCAFCLERLSPNALWLLAYTLYLECDWCGGWGSHKRSVIYHRLTYAACTN